MKYDKMRNNIFKGSKFGDRFMTRDGHMSIFISNEDFYFDDTVGSHDLLVQEYGMTNYFDNGKCTSSWDTFSTYEDIPECELDIVSVWKEKIDEEKLDGLAKESWRNRILLASAKHVIDSWDNFIDGFKAGYRKGIENAEYNKL